MNVALLLPLVAASTADDKADLIGKWITTQDSHANSRMSVIRMPAWVSFEKGGVCRTFDSFLQREEKENYKIVGDRIEFTSWSPGAMMRSAKYNVQGDTLRMWDWKRSLLTENIELVAIRAGAKGPSVIANPEIGLILRGIDSSDARHLAGSDRAGVAVDGVISGGIADRLDLKRNDVIVQVNGQWVTKANEVSAALEAHLRDKTQALELTVWRARSKEILSSGPAVKRGPKMVFVGDTNSDALALLTAAGLDVRPSEIMPAHFEGIGVVIVHSNVANDRTIAPRLQDFIQNGGGVVLLGNAPLRLSMQDPFSAADTPLHYIKEWFGTDWMANTDLNENPEVVAGTDKPFGLRLGKGSKLYQSLGTPHLPYIDKARLDSSARVVGEWKGGLLNRNNGCAAFARTYGKGRVYYQFDAGSSSKDRLSQLFLAGTRWAAGMSE